MRELPGKLLPHHNITMGTANVDCRSVFNSILNQLLVGTIVPLLGAGVSNSAKHNGGMPALTNIRCMGESIKQAINELCRGSCLKNNEEKPNTCLISNELRNHSSHISFDRLCELWEMSCTTTPQPLQKRCELVSRILMIQEFTNLDPTPAHYYIAFLVREGLIDEVVTTNYDTCLEKAYGCTFGQSENNNALVIDSLTTYRQSGGNRFTSKNRHPLLKIYKINGCARQLSESCKQCEKSPTNKQQAYCPNILLTEKDLRDWQKRFWARDLFRDRLRSRSILFSGFGSDEPQVRYTMLQVCEEISTADALNKPHDQPCRANSPYVVAYEAALSYSQTQILHSYSMLHGGCTSSENEINRGVSLQHGLRHYAITGSDAEFFLRKSPATPQLPADLFWQRLYQAAYWKLFGRACGPKSAAVSFLGASLPCAAALMSTMARWFVPADEEKFPFGRFPEILELSPETKTTPLMNWVESARRSNVPDKKICYYSLDELAVIIPVIFLMIYLFIGYYEPDIEWAKLQKLIQCKPLGLSIDISRIIGEQHANVEVCLVHSKAAAEMLPNKIEHDETREKPPNKGNENLDELPAVVIQMVIGSWRAAKDRVYFQSKDRTRPVIVRQIPLLQLWQTGRSIPDVHRELRKSLLATSMMADTGRKSIGDRTVLLPG